MVVSKADALIEMVKAYDKQRITKANRIGDVVNRSIEEDKQCNVYNQYVKLNRATKQLFPQSIRKDETKIDPRNDSVVCLQMNGNIYEISVAGDSLVIHKKK